MRKEEIRRTSNVKTMLSNCRRFNTASPEPPLPRQPPVVSSRAATQGGAEADVEEFVRSSAHHQHQRTQPDFQLAHYHSREGHRHSTTAFAASPETTQEEEPSDASAMRHMIAQRLAAAVVAERNEMIAHERLLRDLQIVQEQRNMQEQYQQQHGRGHGHGGHLPPQSYELYHPSVAHREYPREAASYSPPPPPSSTLSASRAYEPFQTRQLQQQPAEDRSYPPAALDVAASSPAVPHPSGGANDDSAETLRAEAEACMALSLLGGRGRRLSVTSVTPAESAPVATPAVTVGQSSNGQGVSPTQRIVSPGASPSPPLSHHQVVQQQKKGTKKVVAGANRPSSGPLKKRKKIGGQQQGAPATGAAAEAGASTEQSPPKKKTKKGRKKENGMPRRPLSAYNIFFSEERERILGDIPADGPQQRSTAERTILERRFSNPSSAVITPQGEQPAQQTQTPNSNKRRKHRRTHGKIGFRDLARTIGQRWKTLPADRMARYKSLAKIDMDRYQEELSAYRKGKMIREVAATVEKNAQQGAQQLEASAQMEAPLQPPSGKVGIAVPSLAGRE